MKRKKILGFIRNYSVPLTGTLFFVLIVGLVVGGRMAELLALRDFAKTNPLISDGSGDLNSRTGRDQLENNLFNNRNGSSVENEDSLTDSSDSTGTDTSPKTSLPNDDNTSTEPATTSGSSGSSSGSEPVINETDPQPEPLRFETQIKDLSYAYSPASSIYTASMCAGTYTARGVIAAKDGPGQITYRWRVMTHTSAVDESAPQTLQAASGDNSYTVTHSFNVNPPGPFKGFIELIVMEPNQSTRKIEYYHECM